MWEFWKILLSKVFLFYIKGSLWANTHISWTPSFPFVRISQSHQIMNLSSHHWDETELPPTSSVLAILVCVWNTFCKKHYLAEGYGKNLKTLERNIQEMWSTIKTLNFVIMATDEGEVNGKDNILADNVTSKNQGPSNKTRLETPYCGQRLPKHDRLFLLPLVDLQKCEVSPYCWKHQSLQTHGAKASRIGLNVPLCELAFHGTTSQYARFQKEKSLLPSNDTYEPQQWSAWHKNLKGGNSRIYI